MTGGDAILRAFPLVILSAAKDLFERLRPAPLMWGGGPKSFGRLAVWRGKMLRRLAPRQDRGASKKIRAAVSDENGGPERKGSFFLLTVALAGGAVSGTPGAAGAIAPPVADQIPHRQHQTEQHQDQDDHTGQIHVHGVTPGPGPDRSGGRRRPPARPPRTGTPPPPVPTCGPSPA